MNFTHLPIPSAEHADREQCSDIVLRQLLLAELAIMERNEACLIQQCNVECLHDFRVAVRRSRIVLARFTDVFPAREVQRVTRQLANLSDITGPCRDLDVLLQHWPEYDTTSDVASQKVYAFLQQLAAKARVDVIAGLTAVTYVDFKTRWRKFLIHPPAVTRMRNAKCPVSELVAPLIHSIMHKLVKRLRAIKSGSADRKLHALRIMSKRLRYVLEYFWQDSNNTASRRLIAELKTLQDVLGVNQDLSIQLTMLKSIDQQMADAGLMQDDVADTLHHIKKIIRKRLGKQRKAVMKAIRHFLNSDALAGQVASSK